MNELKDKIKKYLKGMNMTYSLNDVMAHDIAEIAEKHYATNLGFTDLLKENINYKEGWEKAVVIGYEADTKIIELEKENAELKEQVEYWKYHYDNVSGYVADKNREIEGLEAKLILRNGRILELEEQLKADECDLCNDLQDKNIELKKTIKYLDSVSMLNEDLIRKNDELKETIRKQQEEIDYAMKIEVRNDKNFGDVLDRKNRIIDKLREKENEPDQDPFIENWDKPI